MNTLNRIMLMAAVIMTFIMFGVVVITLLNGNLICALLGLFFAVIMALIVKHWENN